MDVKQEAGEADWKARVDSIADDGNTLSLQLTFFNETLDEKFTHPLSASADVQAIINMGRDLVARRPGREQRKSEIYEGMVLNLAPLPPTEVIPPTPEEVARSAFFTADAQYREAARYEVYGFDASGYLASAAKLFRPEYVGA